MSEQEKICRKGHFCFASLLDKMLGVEYDDRCLKCFAANGITVSNRGRRKRTNDL